MNAFGKTDPRCNWKTVKISGVLEMEDTSAAAPQGHYVPIQEPPRISVDSPSQARTSSEVTTQNVQSHAISSSEPESPRTTASDSPDLEQEAMIPTSGNQEFSETYKTNSFVLVKFVPESRRAAPVHYVGKIVGPAESEGDYEITFLKHKRKRKDYFYYPNTPDVCDIPTVDILVRLPDPFEDKDRQTA
jgi:hypothetical protein